jgi:hypothetical protein
MRRGAGAGRLQLCARSNQVGAVVDTDEGALPLSASVMRTARASTMSRVASSTVSQATGWLRSSGGSRPGDVAAERQRSREPPCGNQDLGQGQAAHYGSMDTCDARWPPRPGRPSAGCGRPPNSGPLRRALRTPPFAAVGGARLLTSSAPEMPCTTLKVPGMDKPSSRYDVTVRVTDLRAQILTDDPRLDLGATAESQQNP